MYDLHTEKGEYVDSCDTLEEALECARLHNLTGSIFKSIFGQDTNVTVKGQFNNV